MGILLIVYITEKLAKHITFIDTDSVPTGIMGLMVCSAVTPSSCYLSGLWNLCHGVGFVQVCFPCITCFACVSVCVHVCVCMYVYACVCSCLFDGVFWGCCFCM